MMHVCPIFASVPETEILGHVEVISAGFRLFGGLMQGQKVVENAEKTNHFRKRRELEKQGSKSPQHGPKARCSSLMQTGV